MKKYENIHTPAFHTVCKHNLSIGTNSYIWHITFSLSCSITCFLFRHTYINYEFFKIYVLLLANCDKETFQEDKLFFKKERKFLYHTPDTSFIFKFQLFPSLSACHILSEYGCSYFIILCSFVEVISSNNYCFPISTESLIIYSCSTFK